MPPNIAELVGDVPSEGRDEFGHLPDGSLPDDDGYEFEEVPEKPGFFEKLLTARTGPGAVTDYKEHPLNFRHSEGLSQVIRGVTGLAGDLDRAFLDIIFGLLRELWDIKNKGDAGDANIAF